MSNFSRLVASLVFVLFLIPTFVFADSVEELSQKGEQAYSQMNYGAAIAFYKEAYEVQEVAVLLFNIAKCYEKQKDWENAKKYYQSFLVAPDVEKKFRESALKKIKNIENTQYAEEKERLARVEREKEEEKAAKRKAEVQAAPPVETPIKNSASKIPAYIVGGVGVGLLAGGGVFALLAKSQESTFKSATTTAGKQDAQSAGKTMALVADGMFVTGGIATAIGIYLFATSDNETDPSLSGWISKTSSGANVRFSF